MEAGGLEAGRHRARVRGRTVRDDHEVGRELVGGEDLDGGDEGGAV